MSDGTDSGTAGSSHDIAPNKTSPDSAIEEFERTQPTERELLRDARSEAMAEKSKATAWLLAVGLPPAALVAVALALLIEGSRNLALGFVALGAATLALKIFRAHRKIKDIEKQLEDPMDGS
jgi:hypothetical protein